MKWFLVTLITLLILLAVFEPSYGWRVREFLSPRNRVPADNASLAAENEALKAQLATLQTVASELPQAPTNYIKAMVYSRYPLNFRNEILLDAGSNEGVSTGKAVVFQGILIGTVETVWSDQSLVRTIFDSNTKLPVRIGPKAYDGLLNGGSYPEVGSIGKSADLHVGDVIGAAAPGIPYGLPIGEIAATSTSPDHLFEEASLNFAYDINTVQTVLIAP